MAHLTLAAVAFDRGDLAGAREQLARAERLVPGSVRAALFAAEMALATDDGAEAAVHQAVKAAKNNPLSFADKEVARLVEHVRGSPPGFGGMKFPPAIAPAIARVRMLYPGL